MNNLNPNYWDIKYLNNETGWDIGYPSPPLTTYFNQLQNSGVRILIPGCGNGYEAEFLYQNGFKNVHVIDYSLEAIKRFKKRNPKFPKQQIHHQDFFAHQSQYDVIVEQTFFCALQTSLRKKYVKKMHSLLNPNGKLIGLLFQIPLNQEHPPFGGNKKDYIALFEPYFQIKTLETCYNSIPPRNNSELFINFSKK